MRYPYILEIKYLLVASFAGIFSWSVGCLFCFVDGSFCYTKPRKFDWSHLCMFTFTSVALGGRPKKNNVFGSAML